LALVGHAALWIGIVNRWHATGFPRALVKSVTLAFYAALVAMPPLVAAHFARSGASWPAAADWPGRLDWATAYVAFCTAYGALHVATWTFERWRTRRPPREIRVLDRRVVDMTQLASGHPARGPRARLFAQIPFNQFWHLEVSRWEVELPRLPAALEGVSIWHLSDLHFSGRIDRGYFDEVVRLANAEPADLVFLTGDVCDRQHYIAWIPETIGRIEARIGKFFVLGNHDLRTRAIDRLRSVMRQGGFVDVAGRRELAADGALAVAGNERPWFHSPAPSLDGVPAGALRVLLSHTPDLFGWARSQGYDLMFAGHTHGGQVRFPLVGPVVCPSWHGTRYAAGFFREPPTLLHVSRGAAGLFPYRLNCRPEITRLVLQRAP
jgi:predicted MPP superfamily phosphohydrolase